VHSPLSRERFLLSATTNSSCLSTHFILPLPSCSPTHFPFCVLHSSSPPLFSLLDHLKRSSKKKIKIFLKNKEIQRDRVQSHIWPRASSYMVEYLRISSYAYVRKPFLIFDFAPDPIWISLYCILEKFCFLFYQRSVIIFVSACSLSMPKPSVILAHHLTVNARGSCHLSPLLGYQCSSICHVSPSLVCQCPSLCHLSPPTRLSMNVAPVI